MMMLSLTVKYVAEIMVLLVALAFVLLLVLRPKPPSNKALSQKGILSPEDVLYEPYKREDQYGLLGAEPQPLSEYARLAVLAVTVVPLKFMGAFLSVLTVNLMCRAATLLPGRRLQAYVIAAVGKVLCRFCLFCNGFVDIKWIIDKPNELPQGVEPAVIVSNHVSYMDILVHMAHSFPSFVARGNTKDMFLLGVISIHLQCIFVDRDFKKGDVTGVSGQVKDRVEKAAAGKLDPTTRPLLLFPEGTTTNGKCLLPFKTGAFLAGAPVQPVILKYGPDRVSPAWDSVTAVWHVFLMLANPFHSMTARQLPIYYPSEEEKKDAKLYAANVRELLLREGGMKASESTLADCRAYISMLQGKPPNSKSQAYKALHPTEANGIVTDVYHEKGEATPPGVKKEA